MGIQIRTLDASGDSVKVVGRDITMEEAQRSFEEMTRPKSKSGLGMLATLTFTDAPAGTEHKVSDFREVTEAAEGNPERTAEVTIIRQLVGG